MRFIVLIMRLQLVCTLYDLVVKRMPYVVANSYDDGLVHLVAYDNADTCLTKISFFQDVLLSTEVVIPGGLY